MIMWSDRAQKVHVGAAPTTRPGPYSERISKGTYRRVGNQRNHLGLGRACEGDAQGWNWSYHRSQQPLGTSSYQGCHVG